MLTVREVAHLPYFMVLYIVHGLPCGAITKTFCKGRKVFHGATRNQKNSYPDRDGGHGRSTRDARDRRHRIQPDHWVVRGVAGGQTATGTHGGRRSSYRGPAAPDLTI